LGWNDKGDAAVRRIRWKRHYWGLRRWLRRWFGLRDLKIWIAHRTWDRYHVVKCRTLEPGYYDQDFRMLHACFELLTDYLEEEVRVWSYLSGRKASKKTLDQDIKAWKEAWLEDKDAPEQQKEWVKNLTELYEWWTTKYEAATYEEETEMLQRLVALRQYLWV
jgi:hypothetical protein